MAIKVLVVEDNEYKRKRICEALESNDVKVKVDVDESYSFTSAWKKISSNNYDLIILDMSLPTFDKNQSEPGGAFRVFGGKELAKKMVKRGIDSKFIFVTQYKSFSDNISSYSFESIKIELIESYKDGCVGFIFYSNTQSDWRDELIMCLKGIDK